MATQKEVFVLRLMELAQTIGNDVMMKSVDLTAQYFDLGYNSGGADEIIDDDLTNFNGVTATQVSNVITALDQLKNYFNNSAVTTGDYASIYNSVRYVMF